MFHLDAVEESPVTFIYGAIDVLELAEAVEFVLGDLGLLLFGRLFDNFLLDLFLWRHAFYNLS